MAKKVISWQDKLYDEANEKSLWKQKCVKRKLFKGII